MVLFADWNTMFWAPGTFHDYCYHSNPITYGKQKEDCDNMFRRACLAVCDAKLWQWTEGRLGNDLESCRIAAEVGSASRSMPPKQGHQR